MLMDRVHESLADTHVPSQRVHFHRFMLDVHASVHARKQYLLATYGRDKTLSLAPEKDALVHVAHEVADSAALLCFDEFQVTDVADALILSKLFGTLFRRGVVVIATSNQPPSELYKGGLNREYFLPFLDLLQTHCRVHDMASGKDHRMGQSVSWCVPGETPGFLLFTVVLRVVCAQRHGGTSYHVADEATAHAEASLADAVSGNGGPPDGATDTRDSFFGAAVPGRVVSVPVMMNRTVDVFSPAAGVALMSFDELCGTHVGAADYQALGRSFVSARLAVVCSIRRRCCCCCRCWWWC